MGTGQVVPAYQIPYGYVDTAASTWNSGTALIDSPRFDLLARDDYLTLPSGRRS